MTTTTHQRERRTRPFPRTYPYVPAPVGADVFRPLGLLQCQALLIGVEGVVTDTARLHALAWQRAVDAFLRHTEYLPRQAVRPFDPDADFRRCFQGRTRQDGVRAFLASRGIPVPDVTGERGDDPVRALAAHEDRLFAAYVERQGAAVWPDSLRLVGALRRHAVPVAAVSASHRARDLLDAAGVTHRFDAVVDGRECVRTGVVGSPDPALLLMAARLLRARPARTAVVVAAPAWMTAARRGGFGPAIGLDRQGRAEHAVELYERGAAHVVRGLTELLPPP